MSQLLCLYLCIYVTLGTILSEQQCKWMHHVKKCVELNKSKCESECIPCLNNHYKKVNKPKCKWWESGVDDSKTCYFNQKVFVDNEETDIENSYECVQCDYPKGQKFGECKKEVICDYTNCNNPNVNCRPCNGYDDAVKQENGEYCYIDCNGKCRYDEYTGNTLESGEKEIQIVSCIYEKDNTGLCENFSGADSSIILAKEPKSYYNAYIHCLDTYGTHLASIYDSEISQATSLMSENGILGKAWIGLVNVYKGGWFEWLDGSCCDNIYGSCTPGNRWHDGHPLPNCDQHSGTNYVNIDQIGYINNDIDGQELLPFFCNCLAKEINNCEISDQSSTTTSYPTVFI